MPVYSPQKCVFLLFSCLFFSATLLAKPIPYRCSEGLWGYVDWDMQMQIPCQYFSASRFDEAGLAVVSFGNYAERSYRLINEEGRSVLPSDFPHIYQHPKGFYVLRSGPSAIAQLESRCKPCQDEHYQFPDYVQEDTLRSYIINSSGQLLSAALEPYLIDTEDPTMQSFTIRGELISVSGYSTPAMPVLDTLGNCLFPAQDAQGFFYRLFASQGQYILKHKYEYSVDPQVAALDKQGTEIIPLGAYKAILDYSEGFFSVLKNRERIEEQDAHGYVNEAGQERIACQYEYAMPFSEGLAVVGQYSKLLEKTVWSYIDSLGVQRITGDFFYCHPFSEGLAAVSFERRGQEQEYSLGYINSKGELQIPKIYDYSHFVGEYAFRNGRAWVSQGGFLQLIDKENRVLFEPWVTGVSVIGPGYYQEYFRDGIIQTAKLFDGELYMDSTGRIFGDFSDLALVLEEPVWENSDKAKPFFRQSTINRSECEYLGSGRWQYRSSYGEQEGIFLHSASRFEELFYRPLFREQRALYPPIHQEPNAQSPFIRYKTSDWLWVAAQPTLGNYYQACTRQLDGSVIQGYVLLP